MRNEILFQNKIISVNGIFYKVVALVLAYDMAKQPDGCEQEQDHWWMSWSRPQIGWVKVNCDGSCGHGVRRFGVPFKN